MLKLNQLDNISQLADLVICPLDSWDVIAVQGEDRISFLQGQLTCDINSLKIGEQTLAAQCTPQGKVCSLFHVILLEDRVLFLQPSSVTEKQLTALQKYAAFSKVKIHKDSEYQAITLLGEKSSDFISQELTTENISKSGLLLPNGMHISKQLTPSLRYLLVLKKEQGSALLKQLEDKATYHDDSLWNAMNIAAGMAFIEEINSEKFIPQMLNLQALDGISFTKGCYIGQETIARAKYRGANKRALFILSGHASCAPKAGDTLQLLLNNQWKRIGSVISACQYGDAHIEVLAVLPKDSQADDIYQIKEIEGSTLYLVALPYPLDN
ncbi:glycine cleavage T protein (aminomethyl transferase) [Psychromonas sp. CNPT3]|uniref:tRNA-modifying protein YgfZ n=1 Tax=Psychromonas sp. CNPT3 TaxID=314282 RepID=UPI00006E710B|nr:tRNA-modifying protein YgfZ [Psychromonas sp. CNPT3]AGH80022.1 glycine cleavage T protein (aminomethyl transferase) [Psychromonas sp. CNPT3]